VENPGKLWSSCSRDKFSNTFQHGGDICLYNIPDSLLQPNVSTCGNGIVETEEECDCGKLPNEVLSHKCHIVIKLIKYGVLIHSFIRLGYFYSAFSSPPLYLEALLTQHVYCHAETPHAPSSDGLAQGPTRRLEPDPNPRPFGRKASNLPMNHHTTCCFSIFGLLLGGNSLLFFFKAVLPRL